MSRSAERLSNRTWLQPRRCRFTGGVSSGDELDVWVTELKPGMGERVKLWIEVGLPEAKRLLKAARHCERVILFAYGKKRPTWESDHLDDLNERDNITVLGVDATAIARLVDSLDRQITWSFTISGGTIYLTSGTQHIETMLEHVAGPPLVAD
ncbi:MAG: YaeQ family protein [Phycisphaeraceae bacterium]